MVENQPLISIKIIFWLRLFYFLSAMLPEILEEGGNMEKVVGYLTSSLCLIKKIPAPWSFISATVGLFLWRRV